MYTGPLPSWSSPGDLEGLCETGQAELAQAFRGELQILQAPAHLFARHCLVAKAPHGRADGLSVVHGVHDAAVVQYLAEVVAGGCRLVAAVYLRQDGLVHRKARSGAVEVAGLVADGAVTRGHDVRLGPRPPHADEAVHRIAD